MMCGPKFSFPANNYNEPIKTDWGMKSAYHNLARLGVMTDKAAFFESGSSWWILSNNWEELNDWKG